MTSRARQSGTFTGRHMLFVMLAFFGTIIAVNMTMAMFATGSWTGLVVKNSYVASQHFNENAAAARAQAALGWTERLEIANGQLRFSLEDAEGAAIVSQSATAVIYRPVSGQDDMTVVLRPVGDGAVAVAVDLGDGGWIVEIAADAGIDRPYRTAKRVFVSGGALR
ncbi:MAG: FixH family protein [Rhizobiaceae bacterium]|nr:FixH family protein [Rhizobiaceae bacterium]